MKTTNCNVLSMLAVGALTWIGANISSFGAELSAADKQFLAGYEQIRVALVADDLASAKKAAAVLGASGSTLASSNSLQDARSSFATLSAKAEQLVASQPGYYVMYCSMVNKDWVQTTTKVGNPYGGKAMANCGEVKSPQSSTMESGHSGHSGHSGGSCH